MTVANAAANPTPRHAVILCHPDADSFNAAVAQRYCETVRAIGHTAVLRDLYRMDFDPVLQLDERPQTDDIVLAADVAAEIEEIRGADVFVLVYPIWFGTPPAMLKGYVERVFGAGFDHRSMRDHHRHSFMADKHLLSLSSSGNSIQWLEGQGAWLSLRNVFDTYLATAFSMDSTEHIHFSNIVDGLTQRSIDEELYRVNEIAQKTCARFVGVPHHKRTRLSLSAFATTVSDDSAIAAPANIGDMSRPVAG
jgi:NAD(P)H dehydrogenase (quinone)